MCDKLYWLCLNCIESGAVKCVDLGRAGANCYAVESNTELLLVDPGDCGGSLCQWLTEGSFSKISIFLTHGHYDHIGAVPAICEAFPSVRIYASRREEVLLVNPALNLSVQANKPISLAPLKDRIDWVEEGSHINCGSIDMEVLECPGHTPGGLVLINRAERWLFSGDSLFHQSIGRTDFPRSDEETLMTSIKEKLMTLDREFIVLPGHMDETTIGEEYDNNPHIRSVLSDTKA